MPARRNLTGQRFSRLEAVAPAPNRKDRTRWICRCDCGAAVTVDTERLIRGSTRSCGCDLTDPQDEFRDWRPVPGYEGVYEVSPDGAVRSVPRVDSTGKVRRGRSMRLKPAVNGYHYVTLWNNGECAAAQVHRLVARAFIGEPPPGKDHVNHKDGNKTNNVVTNLEWVSNAENVRHAHLVLRVHRARPIVGINPGSGERLTFRSIAEARRSGFSKMAIGLCLSGKQPMHRGYLWHDLKERQ